MAYTDYKQKHSKIVKSHFNKSIHMEELVNSRTNARVKENFYRPAYGKIGERGECYGER